MTNDAITIVTTTLAQSFRLLTSWLIPGTNFTPAQWFFGIAVMIFGIRYIGKVVGSADTVVKYSRRHNND